MKKAYILKGSAILLVGLLTAFAAAPAATTAYSDGDILLGFRATGGTGSSSELVVNLGTFSQFQGNPSTFNVTNILTDLTNTYGTFGSRTDLYWGVMGVDDGSTDVFATRGPSPATAWVNKNFPLTQQAVGAIESAGSGFAGLTSGSNTSAAVESNASSTNNHWSLYAPTIGGFLSLPGIDQPVGTSTMLDFFQLSGDGSAVGAAATKLGTFTLNTTTGVVSFGASAVPEPGRAVLLGFGLVTALFRRRRKAAVAA